jgi:hypothetical protein
MAGGPPLTGRKSLFPAGAGIVAFGSPFLDVFGEKRIGNWPGLLRFLNKVLETQKSQN